MNPSLAEYHVPVNMDVPHIDIIYTGIPDEHAPLGARGIGEIGITGRRRPSRMQSSTPLGSAFGTCRSRSTSSSKKLAALGPEVSLEEVSLDG